MSEVGSGSQRATARLAANTASLDCAFPSNVSSGNLLVVTGSASGSSSNPSSVTDTLGTSYTLIKSGTFGLPGTPQTFIAYGFAPSSGANTVTVTNAVSAYIGYSIDEFSGIDSFEVDGGASSGTSTSPSDSLTTLSDGSLILSALYKSGTTPITPDGTYTQIGEEEDDGTYIGHSAIFKIGGTAGSESADWTLGASQGWIAQTVAFKPVPGGGAAVSVNESLSANEAQSIDAAISTNESLAATEGQSVAVALTAINESLAATEGQSVAADTAINETWAGSEEQTVASALTAINETLAASEASSVVVSVSVAESWTGSENVSVDTGSADANKSVSETWGGSESQSVAVNLTAINESLAANEAQSVAVALTAINESWIGSESTALSVLPSTVNETWTGSESVSVAITLTVAEGWSGTDAQLVAASLTAVNEPWTGTELVSRTRSDLELVDVALADRAITRLLIADAAQGSVAVSDAAVTAVTLGDQTNG